MRSAFISYSHSDGSEIARHFYGHLSRAGLPVSMDERQLEPGSPFEPELLARIRQSHFLFVFLTPAARASPWVEKEIAEARLAGVTVVPVRCDDGDLPESLAGLHSPLLGTPARWWQTMHILAELLEDNAAPIPRVVNLANQGVASAAGLLVLLEFKGYAVLHLPEDVLRSVRELADLVLPILQATGAGLVPPSLSAIAVPFIVELLGRQNHLPRLYWFHNRSESPAFWLDASVSTDLQHLRESARGERPRQS